MNAFSLALRSLRHKALSTTLNLLLMAVGIAVMTFVLSVSRQLQDHALRDASGIDLVVGAKGSPLQLILSSIYHIDVPTGNIPLAAQVQLAQNRLVKKVIPLALGDSYNGFRIVGTNLDYIAHYGGSIASGVQFHASMEAVLGSQAAAKSGAVIGAKFAGSHGLASGGEGHRDEPFTVVGILKPTGTVLDRLILTSVDSVWKVHEVESGHHLNDKHEKDKIDSERELTALLVEYASPLAALSMPRLINRQTELQAAQPAFEITKLFRLVGVGIDVLRGIAALVLFAATLSMFVALYHALEERKADLAILRALGAPPHKLVFLLLSEGCTLALAGTVIGWVLGHIGVGVLGFMMAKDQPTMLNGFAVEPNEAWLLIVATGVGVLASILPAMRAYKTDVVVNLSA